MREDDRPHLEPGRRPHRYAWATVALGIALMLGAVGLYFLRQPPPQPTPSTVAPPQASVPPVEQDSPEPAIRHPLVASQPEAPQLLPSLDNSDSMMRDSLSSLIGGKAFDQLVIPQQLVRRIVATVDNLPRPTAPRRVLPLNPVPGRFTSAGPAEESAIDARNFARYAPYVRVVESIDARALVNRYVRAYPLFQRAYEELGYPGKYFNDRLVEALDDLLAAPELDTPAKLVRPKVLFQFAEPEHENRSAGQKIMLRMGKDNAARVKAKLRDIRLALVAASGKRPEAGGR